MPPFLVIPELDDLARRYQAGESIKALSQQTGVSRGVLAGALKRSGVHIRDRSEAMFTRMGNTSAEERQRLAAAAHDAVRGMTRTDADLRRRALGKQQNRSHASPAQLRLADLLAEAGVDVGVETAVGKFNVDLTVGPVAVEVCGGHWHLEKRHRARCGHLFDAGYNLVFVWVDGGAEGVDVGAAEYVLAFLEETESDPSLRREYRVIRGSGEYIARGRADGDDWTLVGPFGRRLD